jgi:hypothetical protein
VHRATRHVNEVADAGGDPILAEEDAASTLDDVERLVLVPASPRFAWKCSQV